MKLVISVLFLSLLSATAQTKEFIYQGKVQGMVCAFCVYSVSKKIAQMPQVDAQSVNVDLKSGTVNFRSKARVSLNSLSSMFDESGFKLTELNEVKQTTVKTVVYQEKPVFHFKLDNPDIEKYESVLTSIGNIAASSRGKLVITAPASMEIAVLKLMIMGKQKIARIQFNDEKNQNTVRVQLFLRAD